MDWKLATDTWKRLFESKVPPKLKKAFDENVKLNTILNLRKSVMFIVRAKDDFRTVFIHSNGSTGITTVLKDSVLLAWSFEDNFAGLYHDKEIYILTPEKASVYLDYLSDDAIKNQERAYKKIIKNEQIYEKDFI